jgi:hypothetical protein
MNFEEALQILEEEKLTRAKANRTILLITVAVIAIASAMLGYAIGSNKVDTLTDYLPFLGASVTLIGVAAGFTPRAQSALLAASEYGDPRVLGHLIEAMSLGDIQTQAISKSLAIQLLSKVSESSIPLDPVQHSCLVQHLTIQDEAFRIALISALPYIGRPETISILESLARGESLGSAKATPRIQANALRVLPELRMRLAKEVIKQKIAEVDAYRKFSDEPQNAKLQHGIQLETDTAESAIAENSANSESHAN